MIPEMLLRDEGLSLVSFVVDSAAPGFVIASVLAAPVLLAILILIGFLAFSGRVRRKRRSQKQGERWGDTFRLLIENSQDAIVTFEGQGDIGYVSPSAERVLGYAPEQLVGGSVFERIHPEDVPGARAAFARSLEAPGETLAVRLRYRHGRRGWRWLDVLGRNVLHIPEVAGIVVNARDVTDQVEAEVELARHRDHLEERIAERTREIETANRRLQREINERRAQEAALEASEACFRSAFHHAPIGKALGGRDRRLRNVNRALCDILGYEEAELLGKSLGELIHPEDTKRSDAYFHLLLKGESDTFRFECRCRHQGGHFIRGLLNVSAIREAGPEVRGFIIQVQDVTEQKQAEASLYRVRDELLQQTRVLDSILSATSDHICLFDHAGRFCYASLAFTEAIGISAEEVIGKRWEELSVSDAAPDPFAEGVAQVLQTGESATSEATFHTQAGHRCVEYVVNPVWNEAGAVVGTVVSARDVTERKRARAELLEQRSLLRALIDNLPHYIYVKDRESRFQLVNQGVLDVNGISNERALLGKTDFDFYPRGLAEEFYAEEQAIFESGEPLVDKENYLKHPAGERAVWTLTTKVPVRNQAGEIAWIACISRDVTERKEAERALRDSEERFRALVQNSSDIVTTLDPDGTIRYESDSVERFLGYDPEQLVGQNAFSLIHPGDRKRVYAAFAGSIEQPGMTITVEYRFRHADGHWVYLESTGANLLQEPGIWGFVVNSRDVTARKEVEEKTRFQAQLLEAVGQAVVATDLEGTITYWNSAAEELYGWPASEAVGRNVVDVTPSDLSREEGARIMERLQKGESWAGEFTVQRQDGTTFPALVYDSPLYDSAGVLIGIVGISSDLTERKRAEEALRESEQRFRTLSGAAFEAILIHEEGVILEVNKRAAELFHYASVEELIGTSVFELTAPESRAKAQEMVERNRTELYNATLQRADGSGFPAELRGRPILFDGRKARVTAVRDITERKQAEEEIVRQRNLLQTLVDHLPGSVYVVDREGLLVVVNKPAADFLGREPSDLVGRKNAEFFPEEFAKVFDARIGQVFATGEADMQEASLTNPRTGRREYAHTTLVPVADEAGEAIWVAGFTQDITERKEAEHTIRELNTDLERRVEARTAELQAANKELEAFAYSVSHDLRSPLRAIDGFSRILLREYAAELSPKAQSYLGKVRDNSVRMGELIEGLLRFSRLSRQPLEKTLLEPARLVREALVELRPLQEGRSVEVEIEELPPCEADPVLLKQVYVNILSNALKFTANREYARIRVGTKKVNERVVYYVNDNGAGFDMAYAGKLFGVFQRLHRTEEYEGTGVGMAIVQRIVHRHGGEIWAEAEPDKGATFFFTLESDSDHGLSAHPDPAGGGQS